MKKLYRTVTEKKDMANIRSRRWRSKNPGLTTKRVRIWRMENIERARENRRDWAKKNPEKNRISHLNNEIKRRGAIGKFTLEEWHLLKIQYGHKCPRCGKCEPKVKLTVDHIIPLTRGGSNWIENIQPLCGPCNTSKFTNITYYPPNAISD